MLRQAYWGSLRPDVGELSKKYTDEKELSGDPNLQNQSQVFRPPEIQSAKNDDDPTPQQIEEAFEDSQRIIPADQAKASNHGGFRAAFVVRRQTEGKLAR